jgi:hypothetical protein
MALVTCEIGLPSGLTKDSILLPMSLKLGGLV